MTAGMAPTLPAIRSIGAFVAGTSIHAAPDPVRRKVRHCVLDAVGNMLAASGLDEGARIAALLRRLGEPGDVPVPGTGVRTTPGVAAFGMGALAQVLDGSDGFRFGGNHPSSAVVPAVIASARATGADAAAVMSAVLAGYEVGNRVGRATHPRQTLAGFHPTGTTGAPAAAAAAARMAGLSAEQAGHAVAIATFLTPMSLIGSILAGATAKPFDAATAARLGLEAAAMAAEGFTGWETILDDDQHGFAALVGRGDAGAFDDLGRAFTIEDVYFKPYHCCRHSHAAVEAATVLHRSGHVSGRVDRVEIHTYDVAKAVVDRPVTAGDSYVRCQLSMPYMVASALVDGAAGPAQLNRTAIDRPAVLELVRRTSVIADDAMSRSYPHRQTARVDMHLATGEVVSAEVTNPQGDPRRPMSEDDLVAKFRAGLSASRRPTGEEWIRAVLTLDPDRPGPWAMPD